MSKVYMNNMPIKEYHALTDWIGSTGWKEASVSPAKFWLRMSPDFKDKDTKAMKFGRIYHKLFLEGMDFPKEFVVFDKEARPDPDKTMGAKVNSEWEAILKSNAEKNNKEICPVEDLEKCTEMKSAMLSYEKGGVQVIKAMMSEAEVEKSLFCDDYLGMKVKCRPDGMLPYMIFDLKTVEDASKQGVKRAIRQFKWDIQIALYSDLVAMYQNGLTEVPNEILIPFYIIAQEKKPPYDYCIYNVSGYYEIGKMKLLRAMEKIKDGVRSGYWGFIPKDEFGIDLSPSNFDYQEAGLPVKGDDFDGSDNDSDTDDGYEADSADDDSENEWGEF